MKIQRKVCLLGSDGVGKTSIIVRYTKGTFSNSYLVTLGVDFYEVKFQKEENGEVHQLSAQVWDLASQKNFRFMRAQYLSYTNFVIIVVDVNRHDDSYIQPWIEDLKQHAGTDVPFIIALNKIDLVNPEKMNEIIKELEDKYHVEVIQTSAKTGENISDVFNHISHKLWINS